MDKNCWALYIGHFIIAMNEIDWMTHVCKQKVLNQNRSKTWIDKTLAKRLESLCKELTARDDVSLAELNTLFSEASDLCDFRNRIAHDSIRFFPRSVD